MRPPWSLLGMTVLGGAAGGVVLGLFTDAWRGLVVPYSLLDLLALLLTAAGGAAAFTHLHHPRRARYVLRRLSSSWLSREVLTTGLLGVALTAAAVASWGDAAPAFQRALDSGLLVLALVALWVTAMIYASLPAMRSWYGPLTVVSMVGIGLYTGWVWHLAALALAGVPARALAPLRDATWAGAAALAGVKALQVRHFADARRRLTLGLGSGLPLGPYRLQDPGTGRPPYRTQTQAWPDLDPGFRRSGYAVSFALLFLVPALLAGTLLAYPAAGIALAVVALAGATGERWLFFADATHSSKLWLIGGDEERAPSRVAAPARVLAFLERYREGG
ncbi:MAG: dimethyl sulfoxide reductase anchor subunit [Firmicutes bacterium]|nr:dimethyl sulfoxide reductase anchor subunit [Bacillota bacterium]